MSRRAKTVGYVVCFNQQPCGLRTGTKFPVLKDGGALALFKTRSKAWKAVKATVRFYGIEFSNYTIHRVVSPKETRA